MFYRILPALLLGSLCCAQQCSLQTVRGTWVSYGQATDMLTVANISQPVPTPFAGLALVGIDNQGRVSASGTGVLGGQVITSDLTGSIQVNPDCTAILNFTPKPPFPPTQQIVRLVVMDNGNEMRAMIVQDMAGKPAGVVYYRRISWSDPQCTSDMVRGVYGITYDGTLLTAQPGQSQPVPAPASLIGVTLIDYQGRMTGAATISAAGNVADFVFPDASIAVNADCTGATKWKAAPKGSNQVLPGQGVDKIVVLNNGDEMILLLTQTPLGVPIMLGRGKRISMLPVLPNW
jgi:hypothetical protein